MAAINKSFIQTKFFFKMAGCNDIIERTFEGRPYQWQVEAMGIKEWIKCEVLKSNVTPHYIKTKRNYWGYTANDE